jgi:hypothetical protein
VIFLAKRYAKRRRDAVLPSLTTSVSRPTERKGDHFLATGNGPLSSFLPPFTTRVFPVAFSLLRPGEPDTHSLQCHSQGRKSVTGVATLTGHQSRRGHLD